MAGEAEKREVLRELGDAIGLFVSQMYPSLIPEAGMNIAFALPGARDSGDVAAVPGGITRVRGWIVPAGSAAFGAGYYITRVVLTAMRFDPSVRSAAVIRFTPVILAHLEEMFLECCSFDRASEPPGIRTMEWGVASCCRDGVPDVIYDRGASGREPMVRLLDQRPDAVAKKILMLSARMDKGSETEGHEWA
jgi:predicted fused transcriptional regulator/phosphomethylpyrimidine kinase